MDKLTQADATSHDIVADNIEKLRALFPEAITEDKIDFETLKEALGEYVETREERYNFSWAGKSKARRLAQTPTTGTLRPCPEESVDWDKTKNLFIEGDNLEVLKLLQKSYQGQVKMIYIDPPYNTGGDFVYPDKYADNLKGYLEYTNQVDADGNKQSSNTESSGRYHSNWLNMMLPRLNLARNLLSPEGFIFISIDESEFANLRKLCESIFGEENFVACFHWKKKSTTSNVEGAEVSPQVDYQICYRKSSKAKIKPRVKLSETREYPEEDCEGKYRTSVIEKKDSGAYKRDSMKFEILGRPPREGKRWQIGIDTAKALEAKGRFFWDGEKIKLKIYDFEDKDTLSAQPNVMENVGTSDSASKHVNEHIFETPELFDNPKPVELINYFISIATDEDDIVLDFFAGSASSGESIYSINSQSNSSRKFVLIQLPEPCPENSEARKQGYETIADISKERIRRAASKIKGEHPDYEGDLGFKVFKLDSSNIEAWDSNADNLEDNVLKAANVLKDDRSELDIVYELFLKYGLDLSYPVNTHEVAGKQVYEIGAGSLFICLEDGITNDFVEALIQLYETFDSEAAPRVVFKDSAFKTDAAKKDAESTLKDAGILDVKCL